MVRFNSSSQSGSSLQTSTQLAQSENQSMPEKMIVETDTELGRDSLELSLQSSTTDNELYKLKAFLQSHGYTSTNPQSVLSHALSLKNQRMRLEHFGFNRDVPLALPQIGQAHEIEFPGLRSKLVNTPQITHAYEFAVSTNKVNGVTEMKIASETLGKISDDATTEVILAPAATRDEYFGIMEKIAQFKNKIASKPRSIKKLFEETCGQSIPKAVDGEIWHEELEDSDEDPCIHTTRGVPIRSISAVLLEPQSKLPKESKLLLKLAIQETDAFVTEMNLQAPHNHKLWESINLSIWMSACEGVLAPLVPEDDDHSKPANKTIAEWTLYAGKNFIGVISRFSAGDLLRSGGLKPRDIEQIKQLFTSSDKNKNTNNFNRLLKASENVVLGFVGYLESQRSNKLKDIAKILRANWNDNGNKKSVLGGIYRDLKMDFLPGSNIRRYPADNTSYGNKVVANTASPSFAHSQFQPRREKLSSHSSSKAPVSGAFEFRSGDFVGNSNIEAHFSNGRKRKRNLLENSWKHFEQYVGRLNKRQRVKR